MPVIVLRVEIAAALLVALALTGCARGTGVDTSGGPLPSTTPVTTPTASSSTSPSSETTPTSPSSPTVPALTTSAILTQYRAFFATLTPASKAPPADRFQMMKNVAVEPELTTVLGGMATSQHQGEVGYGSEILRPHITGVVGSTAILRDCQDTSHVGRLNVATGKKVTVGYKDDLAIVTMNRAVDGVWRVAKIQSKPAGSCTAA